MLESGQLKAWSIDWRSVNLRTGIHNLSQPRHFRPCVEFATSTQQEVSDYKERKLCCTERGHGSFMLDWSASWRVKSRVEA